MRDIFGVEEPSLELKLFEKVSSLYEFEEALQDFREYVATGMPVDQAVEKAAASIIPLTWVDPLVGQSPEQPSN